MAWRIAKAFPEGSVSLWAQAIEAQLAQTSWIAIAGENPPLSHRAHCTGTGIQKWCMTIVRPLKARA